MATQLRCILILVFFLIFCSLVFAQTDEECLDCHGEKDFTTTDESGREISLFVEYPLLVGSVRGGFERVTCHSGVLAEPHDTKPEKVDCPTCHDLAAR